MSNPENRSRLEEMAALHALDFLDEAARRELLEAAQRDPGLDRLTLDFSETAALLAYEPPEIEPPPELRREILRQLPARDAKIIPFTPWLPYAVAAGLMLLGISQARQILDLKAKLLALDADASRLRASNALIGLRLAKLEAKDAANDAAYASSQIMVAWDPNRHQGVVSMQNLPVPPPGHDYQLWVLDPGAESPISAGLITGSRSFSTTPVSMPTPGFAISLEPAGGSPAPTGPILFAVAPGP